MKIKIRWGLKSGFAEAYKMLTFFTGPRYATQRFIAHLLTISSFAAVTVQAPSRPKTILMPAILENCRPWTRLG